MSPIGTIDSAGPASGGRMESHSLSEARSRFLVNVGSNVFYLAVNTGLMVWYIPFLLRNLGTAAYGMIALANSLVMYAAIISTSLDVSINRLLAIDINQGNIAGANRTFNSALALSLLACGVLMVPAGIVAYYFRVLFRVPDGLGFATQFLFIGVAITTLTAILSGNFGVSSLITHRFILRNIVRVLTSLSRAGVVVFCFTIWPATLWHVTAGYVVSAGVGLIGDVLTWRRLTPQLRIDRRDIDHHKFRMLADTGGWAIVNQIGFLLLLQIDLLVVNAMFGAEMTGRYGSVLIFPALIHMATETVAAVLSPIIMARFAVGDFEGIRRIATRSVKYLGIGLAMPVGLLCGFGGPLLNLWLGPDFVGLDAVVILLVGHLAVNLGSRPLGYVITAFNQIRVQGLVTLALGIANIGLAIVLARGWGVVGVAAATAIVWTIRNVIVLSGYCAALMHLHWWTFYMPLVAGTLGTLGIILTGKTIVYFWWPTSWLSLGLMAAAVAAVYSVVAYLISLNRSDRDFLWRLIDRRSHG